MTDRRGVATAAAALLFVVCLFVAAVAPPAVAGGTVTPDIESASGSSSASTTDSHHEAIAPALRSTSGSTEIVVRFEGDAGVGPSGTREPGASGGVSTDELKADAANAQTDFERFAEGNPAVEVERQFWLANAMLVTVNTDRVPVEHLLDVRGVERVHENFEVELDSTATARSDGDTATMKPLGSTAGTTETVSTTSTGTTATYGVEMVRAPEVWETFGTRGEGATVAVLDTGVDPDHPDLTVSGWAEIDENGDVIQNDDGPYDLNGHGTHVAGTVAGGNSSGTAIGVAPDARVHAIKVFPDDSRSTTFTRVVGGMEAALDESVVGEPADIVHMSLGADGTAPGLVEPVRNTRSAGVLVSVSAGNSGHGTSSSPGNVFDSLAVGAVDDTRDVAAFSGGQTLNSTEDWNWTRVEHRDGPPADWPAEYVVPDVSAPGVSTNSTIPGGGYERKSGTSMAAPHVSGVAALVLSAASRDLSDDELYETLRKTTNHPENNSTADTRYGTGIVDGFAAVSSVAPFYEVSNVSTPAAAERAEPLNATATVTNTGGEAGDNRTVELRLADPENASNVTTLAAENVSLGAGNATTVSLNGTVPSEFGTGETTVTIASPEDDASVSVRIAEAVGTVNGTVTDAETDATLSNVDVVVENGTEVVGTTATDTDGTYAIKVPATNLTVTASNATYAPANQTVELSESGDVATANFSLSLRDGTLAGAVNASDGLDRPANATVTVTNETDATVAAIDADEDGAYAVELRPDTYNVTADASDFEPVTQTAVVIEPNATTDPVLELDPKPSSLSGTVTNSSDGEAVPDAEVTVGEAQTNTTDANGTYAIGDLDRGEREGTVSADGYTQKSQQVTLAANDTRELDVSLSPRGVFTITDLSGPDEIEQGANGEFGVTVQNDGRAADDASVGVALSPSGSASPNPVTIDGVAVDSHGSETFTVSIGSSASTGTYTVTASTGDDSHTASFEVVSGDDGGSDDGTSGGGGGASGGGGGGGANGGGGGGNGGDGQTQPPADDTDDETEDETDDETTNETDDIADEEELDDDTGELDDGDTPEDTDDDTDDDSEADSQTDGESDDPQLDETTDDDAPGFGVAAGVMALLTGILWARRTERSN